MLACATVTSFSHSICTLYWYTYTVNAVELEGVAVYTSHNWSVIVIESNIIRNVYFVGVVSPRLRWNFQNHNEDPSEFIR